jgi:hypothetical protein
MLTRLASVSGTLAQTSLVADFGGFLQVCTIKVSHSGGSLHESLPIVGRGLVRKRAAAPPHSFISSHRSQQQTFNELKRSGAASFVIRIHFDFIGPPFEFLAINLF